MPSAPKAEGLLTVNQTGPQLPFSKIKPNRSRWDAPLLAGAPWQVLPRAALTMLAQGTELELPGTGSTAGMGALSTAQHRTAAHRAGGVTAL